MQNINNLPAGSYSLLVTDSSGCTITTNYSLVDPLPFSPTKINTDIDCYGNENGSISVINEPNSTSYLWSNGSTSNSITNLSSGNYSVTIHL